MYALGNKASSCQNSGFISPVPVLLAILAFSGAKKLDNTINNLLLFADLKYESGPVAQRLEQWTHNPLVVGSNPTGPIKKSLFLK